MSRCSTIRPIAATPATVGRIEAIAWDAYKEGRKAPVTRKAGRGFADPAYDLSVEWYATRQRLRRAERLQKMPNTRSRVLIVAGAARNDGTCPGEISKTDPPGPHDARRNREPRRWRPTCST